MRVLAANISTGLTATTFAAAALVGVIATGLTPSSTAQAAAMQDHACAAVGGHCGETTGPSSQKKTPNLAAHVLSNKVLMDVMLGNAKSNPELTVGCGASGICVTLIPDQATDPDHVGVPGLLTLTSDSGSGPQSFPSPSINTAFIAGVPATGRFAGRSNRVAAGPLAARSFSSNLFGSPASNPPGPGSNSPGKTPGSPAPGGPIGDPINPGPNDPGNPGGGDPGDGTGTPGDDGKDPEEKTEGPGPVFEPPFIDVDEPVEVIRVPEPSTLFIFGFALLAMAAFGARQTQAATSENRGTRARR